MPTSNSRSDWRVRLTLAPEANYLYRAADPGILKPLRESDGVIFPYMPDIDIAYRANYDAVNPAHTNYSIYQYKNSQVDAVNIRSEFTAQDTNEAQYMLAVIHFFKSITKMFYGQDSVPKNGTPPPLVYMFGLGEYQFNGHPLAVRDFQYTLPSQVDYVKTTNPRPASLDQDLSGSVRNGRLSSLGVEAGGTPPRTIFPPNSEDLTTYVPTKINIVISCVPIVSRNQISNKFSFKDYATGKLLQGSKNQGGGLW